MLLPKVFRVAPGYEVVKGYVTYGAGLLIDVEHDESVEVYAAPRQPAARHLGKFSYEELRPAAPPAGLIAVE